eukprot:1668265-Prymnesium_polylepis.1
MHVVDELPPVACLHADLVRDASQPLLVERRQVRDVVVPEVVEHRRVISEAKAFEDRRYW